MTEPIGRRERKKAQTRRSLADAALRLFLERGYDQVGVKDVAEAADVSVTTLFKHFPGKEALVFDQDEEIEAALVAVVRDRTPGTSIPRALREHLLVHCAHPTTPEMAGFLHLVEQTPALRDYSRAMWLQHETAVAEAIAADIGAPADDASCLALARFALESRELARRTGDPRAAITEIFALLESGWAATHPGS